MLAKVNGMRVTMKKGGNCLLEINPWFSIYVSASSRKTVSLLAVLQDLGEETLDGSNLRRYKIAMNRMGAISICLVDNRYVTYSVMVWDPDELHDAVQEIIGVRNMYMEV